MFKTIKKGIKCILRFKESPEINSTFHTQQEIQKISEEFEKAMETPNYVDFIEEGQIKKRRQITRKGPAKRNLTEYEKETN